MISKTKRFLYTLVLTCLSASSLLANTVIFQQPEDGREPILKLIRDAKKSICIELYHLNDEHIIRALKAAKKLTPHLSIQVILEQNPFDFTASRIVKTRRFLETHGIEVKWGYQKYEYTHSNFMIFDRKQVIIMTMNMNVSAFKYNREYIIQTDQKPIVEELSEVFKGDWNRRRSIVSHKDLVWSPTNARKKITTLIDSAKKSISITAPEIRDPDLIRLLTQKAKEGIDVRLILPPLNSMYRPGSHKHPRRLLIESKVDIRICTELHLHARTIVIDSKEAFIGSQSLTRSALDDSRALGILLTNDEIVQQLSSTFEEDWQHSNTSTQ